MVSTYVQMLRQADQEIAPLYFILAGFFAWLLLAGFLVSPSTFVSKQNLDMLDKSGHIGQSLAGAVRNVPLLYIAALASFSAMTGLGWLWWKWRRNFIWVTRYIVM
ncbi:hypothetical protein NLG97_g1508 [Lecanicillium saksenae]|uniref:Uncharacterized protein n=1 Tax=Lecanicillium saksenae TaxID=468837 RepID=A0ACC1R3K5_9HYPO|nr:hypothetical protein NLG97_g1508 [Lecanicillium saksenae]